jgi:hypothetical protein
MMAFEFIKLSLAFNVGVAVLCGAFLAVLVWRRDLWLRYTSAEATLNRRLPFGPRFANATRRFQESRAFVYSVMMILMLSLFGAVMSGRAYLQVKEQIRQFMPSGRAIKM